MESEDEREEMAPDVQSGLTRSQAVNLYISHTFSTWNARGYEFAAILFTTAAYPNTLEAAALRMIIVYIAMILLSSSVGHWVERSQDRLRTLVSTILCNRASVILGSFLWMLILSQENLLGETPASAPPRFVLPRNDTLKGIIFSAAITLGIIERLSASANLISMERDWVVTVAGPTGHPYGLSNLNAVMRRIDLVCKLLSPILVSIIISATGSVRIGVLYTGFTSLISIPIEFISAKRVWNGSPVLQAPKALPPSISTPGSASSEEEGRSMRIRSLLRGLHRYFEGLKMYFTSAVWIPSVALAMLHFNMLTWRATFITYLINIGYSLNVITIARAIGSMFEITSTVITPRGIVYFGRTGQRLNVARDESEVSLLQGERQTEELANDAQTMVGLQRLGLWGMSSQLITTIPVVLAIWVISAQRNQGDIGDFSLGKTHQLNIGWSVLLFSFLAFSRLGVWIYDLTTQQITQTLLPKTQRSSFAGVENSVINVFEVMGAGAAIAFPRVEQYPWLALASLVSVAMAWCLYSAWVRSQRGHLVHWEKICHMPGERS
ncbi:Ferroportin1-domain-containing protein [Xylaria sp. CBS 124048]|nr:Ferroportin1-domain-containing protein [Xylaria sp. CBS 124048]